MQILRSNLLRIAGSKSQGKLVAPSTKSFPPSCPTPSICTKNQVLTLLLDSLSPSLLLPVMESTSSMKIMLDFSFLAISKRYLTTFSLSPTYLLIMSLLEILKKVDQDIQWAQALAMKVLPVPGGPYSRIPFHGFLVPLKISGKRKGIMTASFKASLAFTKPATSSHVTDGFSLTITWSRLFFISCFSSLASLFNIFFLPSLFLMQSLICLRSSLNSSRASLKASLVLSPSSLRSYMNLRYTFLMPSLAVFICSKSPSLLASLNFSMYSSIFFLYSFQVSYISILFNQQSRLYTIPKQFILSLTPNILHIQWL